MNNLNNDGIVNNDQGYFRNMTTDQITSCPTFNLAVFSNTPKDKTPDVNIMLNTNILSWSDFTNLFFKSPSGAFYINPSNSNASVISFNYQTYKTTFNKYVIYNLADQVKKAWSKKNNMPEGCIPVKANIQLERETFLTKNLGSICGSLVGLSYDEMLSSLLGSGVIAVGTSDDYATINFLVDYNFYYEPLDITLATTFTFITSIPCFKNTTPFCCDCSPYSNDTKVYDRSNIDLDNISVFSDLESRRDEYSVNSNYNSVNTNMLSAISKIVNDKSDEKDSSSQW